MTVRNSLELPRSVWEPWQVPDEEAGNCPYITFPEVFKKTGYQTFATGKQHNGSRIFKRGFTSGAKLFFNGMHNDKLGGHLTPHVSDFDPEGDYETTSIANKFSTELFSDAASGVVLGNKDRLLHPPDRRLDLSSAVSCQRMGWCLAHGTGSSSPDHKTGVW
jgi:arylsulfatase A-like enzyme